MFKATQKTLRFLIFFFGFFSTLCFLIIALFWFGIHIQKEHETRLAFWLPHDFSTGVQSTQTLINQLQDLPVTDLYFHVGPIQEDGGLPKDLKLDADTFAALSSTDYAWIGQIRRKIDLENSDVRAKIVDSAKELIAQGFEGLHIDIEPIREDDSAFIILLQELELALPKTPISVAMDEWQPDALTQQIAQHFEVSIESYWSTEQIEKVLPYVDQLVVMTYDTGFHDPKLYSWWVEQQTLALSNRVSPTVELFIGIPCYTSGTHFDPNAENLSSAFTGYEQGVNNLLSNSSRISGLAIYPYWEMDDTEWTTLKNYFQKAKP